MPNLKTYIYLCKQLCLVWVLLFSLAPCAVKDFLGSSLDSNFQRSLNKTKSTSTPGSCLIFLDIIGEASAAQENDLKRSIPAKYGFPTVHFQFLEGTNEVVYTYIRTGNSPPKYILYKRLKIDIA